MEATTHRIKPKQLVTENKGIQRRRRERIQLRLLRPNSETVRVDI